MARYVMIESRDPFEFRDVSYYTQLANELADKGDEVTLFLVQNAALATRKNIPDNPLAAVVGSKVDVVVDSFSLRERGIGESARLEGIRVADIDALVDMALEDGAKVIWH